MTPSSQHARGTVCPYLGIKNDPTSHMAFPAPLNYCHYCYPSAAVNLKHQIAYCLDESYTACEVYNSGEGSSLPKSFRLNKASNSGSGIFPLFVTILFGMLLAGMAFWALTTQRMSLAPKAVMVTGPSLQTATLSVEEVVAQTLTAVSAIQTEQFLLAQDATLGVNQLTPPATPTPTFFPTLTDTPTNTPTETFTPTITRTPTASNTPTATSTSTPIPPFSLDYPIGRNRKFVIHRVKDGENMNMLAETFFTSIEAIQAVNYNLQIPIRSGVVMVVPLNTTDVTGPPLFEPYQVVKDLISIEEIAVLTGTDPQQLLYYNNCPPGQTLSLRSWVLIPRIQNTPTLQPY